MSNSLPFWRTKSLAQMTPEEWESLCDGCGKCCLHKLEDADTGEVYGTCVACRLLDLETVRCKNYAERTRFVPDCIVLDAKQTFVFKWLPESCGYRRVHEGKDLPAWHPLYTGSTDSVHDAGRSIRGVCISEDEAGDLEDHLSGPIV